MEGRPAEALTTLRNVTDLFLHHRARGEAPWLGVHAPGIAAVVVPAHNLGILGNTWEQDLVSPGLAGQPRDGFCHHTTVVFTSMYIAVFLCIQRWHKLLFSRWEFWCSQTYSKQREICQFDLHKINTCDILSTIALLRCEAIQSIDYTSDFTSPSFFPAKLLNGFLQPRMNAYN